MCKLPPLFSLLLLSLLSACATPYRPAQFMEPDARFPGLVDFVQQAPDKAIDVLLVHGMCTHDATWAAGTVQLLAGALSTNTGAAQAAARLAPAGQIEIVPLSVRTVNGTIRFKSLIWSPLTTPLKQQLCYDQGDPSPICAGAPPYPLRRAGINAKLKDVLLDDCIPDALIYQGVARDAIQERMREAVLSATSADGQPPNAPLVVISESLGSKILFDTLSRMVDEPAASRAAAAAQTAIDRLAYLALAANQIPLLGLADQGLAGATERPAARQDSLQRLLQKRRTPTAAAAVAQLTLVAFTDPNDVLGYTLLRERYARPGVDVFNVIVSNSTTYFGLFERPDLAHLRYLENPDVGRLISCGRPASALCR